MQPLIEGQKSGFAKGVAKIMSDAPSFKADKGTVFCEPGQKTNLNLQSWKSVAGKNH